MNKTHTLEELHLAQAKGCKIEGADAIGQWWPLRIHHADEWKACLPRLKDGAEWHRNDFTNEMLEGGYRPLLHGEVIEEVDEFCYKGIWEKYNIRTSSSVWIGWPCLAHYTHQRTRRPVPPEFLHPDELAKQPEAAQAPDFGEPWQPLCEMIFDRDGDYVAEFQPPFHDSSKVAARAIACVNALSGVPDPAEFVRQAKEMKEAIKEAHEALCNVKSGRGCLPGFDLNDAMPDIETTLSKLQLFLP
jgi:hypothetical protein